MPTNESIKIIDENTNGNEVYISKITEYFNIPVETTLNRFSYINGNRKNPANKNIFR